MNHNAITELLRAKGQSRLIAHMDTLPADQRQALIDQIAEMDLDVLQAAPEAQAPRGEISPLEAMSLAQIDVQRAALTAKGLGYLRQGRVAAVMLAGGQGTRLGLREDQPKGTYDIGVTKPYYIFQAQIQTLMGVSQAAGRTVPLCIMTSDKTHARTVEFLEANSFFGYPSDFVFFYRQEMAPCIDFDGNLLLAAPDRLASSPNGNGGWFHSLCRAGLLPKLRELGVTHLNVFAVDNVLQNIADPAFVGATIDSGKDCGAKVVYRAAPDERIGVLCSQGDHPCVIEYFDMTDEMKSDDGVTKYPYGVILNYLFSVDKLAAATDALPVHRVAKKIPYWADGTRHEPAEPNGHKLETLVVDQILRMDSCLPFEVARDREFAPIKQLTGIDSVESARALLEKEKPGLL